MTRSSSWQTARATASVPFTCGELVQGRDQHGPFLVSCPIDRYSTVTVALNESGAIHAPRERPKAAAAVGATLASLGFGRIGADVTVRSHLPPGRGFGTSTADIAAAVAATSAAAGSLLPPAVIAELAVQLEPSDGTMLPGLATFDHLAASRMELLGAAPSLGLLVLDFGGEVDTVAHHARHPLMAAANPAIGGELLGLVRGAVGSRNPAALGRAATRSALENQTVLTKPALPAAVELSSRVGGFGVCAAHSGTALGLLLPADRSLVRRATNLARQMLPGLVEAWPTRIVDGGIRLQVGGGLAATGPRRCQG